MFILKENFVSDRQRLADWVELSCLTSDLGQLARGDVQDVFMESGLFDDLDQKQDETIEETVKAVWRILRDRIRQLGKASPFTDQKRDLLERKADSWDSYAAYLFLMLLDVGRDYSTECEIKAESNLAVLFERVVRAAIQNQLRGSAVRFGWPREPDWPTAINDRIQTLADELHVIAGKLEGKTKPEDKDRGLDVACRLSLGDDGPGTITLLTQCAIGKNWNKKRGETSIAEWHDILEWDSKLLCSVAVPWRLTEDEIRRQYRHFDAVIWDRIRLSVGHPDTGISDGDRIEIAKWCNSVLTMMPRLQAM